MHEFPQGLPFLQIGCAPVGGADVLAVLAGAGEAARVGVEVVCIVPVAAGFAVGCRSLLIRPGFFAGAAGVAVVDAVSGVAVSAALQAALLALPFLVQS